jgi:hypothetical protein
MLELLEMLGVQFSRQVVHCTDISESGEKLLKVVLQTSFVCEGGGQLLTLDVLLSLSTVSVDETGDSGEQTAPRASSGDGIFVVPFLSGM